jgi:hypothetical protein
MQANASYTLAVRRRPSTVGQEIFWFLLWLAVFVAIALAMLRYVVPHHFNDRIAILIAALLAGLIIIGLRGWYFGQRR